MLLQRLKFVGFFYVPMRHHKDVSNRFISFTYQLRHRDDISAWSATSWPIWLLNDTSLRRRMLGGIAYEDFKNLTRRTTSGKILRDEAFNIAINPKYEWISKRSCFNGLKIFWKKKPLACMVRDLTYAR